MKADRLRMLGFFACIALAASWRAPAAEPDEEEEDEAAQTSEIVVMATRSRHLVRDQAVRVEVVPQEELEEAQSVAPGDLTNLLNELAGARIASSAPGLGGATMELRGLPGRLSQVLMDGLPLAGNDADSFGLLQTPPIDLKRVEVIKGVASALYGGSALGGVMNLVSRAPDGESNLLLNQSSVGGSDAEFFYGGKAGAPRGMTLTAGANYQDRRDRDGDGWAEVPGYRRATIRPRWFFNPDDTHSMFATLGAMAEDREGGTTPGSTLPDGRTFPERLRTRRADGGFVGHFGSAGGDAFDVKMSGAVTRHERQFGELRESDDESAFSAEGAMQGKTGAHDWVMGAALDWQGLETDDVAGVNHHYFVPAVFAQDEIEPASWVSIAGSARVDVHNEFGTFVSPRISALFRLAPRLSVRASAGSGFAAPSALVDEVQETGLAVVEPLAKLRAERATSASLDLGWRPAPFDINLSVFSSSVRNALSAVPGTAPRRIAIVNSAGPLEVRGAELLVGISEGPAHVLLNTTHLDVTEDVSGTDREWKELIPRNTAEIAAIFEDEDLGRAGFEISYTGPQVLHEDPFRDRAPSFVEINALAEWRHGNWAVYANAFNITNVRQRHWDPLLLPPGDAGLGGSPISDVWASQLGRWFSAGVRARL